MNMSSLFLACCLSASLVLAPCAMAQGVKPEDRNAALRYATIAYSANPELMDKARDADAGLAGFDLAAAPDAFKAAARAIEVDGSSTVGQIIEATRMKKCDFEVPWENGVSVLLPHLGKMRSQARLLRVDARRLAMMGDADGAAERLAALVRLSRHAAGDHILISSLVGIAICSLAIEETGMQFEAGKLTPGAKATILASLNALDRDDPFSMKAALRGEQRWTFDWIKAKFHGDDAGKKLVGTALLQEPIKDKSARPPSDPNLDAIAKLNEQALHAAADQALPLYEKMLGVWNDPEAVTKLTAISKDIEGGTYGPLAKVLAPNAANARKSTTRIDKDIAEMKQKLGAAK